MHKLKNRIFRSVAIVMSFMFVLSACAKKEEAVTQTASVVEEAAVEEPTSRTYEGTGSLLTNEVFDKDLSQARPLAVMIENTKPAYPHYGLCDAGVVYEMPEEGGITRYMALYDQYDGYDRLGGIRSARPYYCLAAIEYHAILAHIGQSVYAEAMLKSLSADGFVEDINGVLGGTSYIRVDDKKAPHNCYLTSEGIKKDIEARGYLTAFPEKIPSHFTFAKDENTLEGGADCVEPHFYFYHDKPYFKYDPETKLYTRYTFGALEPDAYSDNGLTYTNIIVQHCASAQHDNDPYIDIDMRSGGEGKFLTRGKVVDITWEFNTEEGRTVYYMPDGSEIELNTGKTFINICETSGIDGNTYE